MTRLNTDYFDLPECPPPRPGSGQVPQYYVRHYGNGDAADGGRNLEASPRACPFCAHATPEVAAIAADPPVYAITCPACGAFGPLHPTSATPSDAIHAWNRRPAMHPRRPEAALGIAPPCQAQRPTGLPLGPNSFTPSGTLGNGFS